MKIIKQGVPPSEKVYSHTCYNCKCEFEYTREEAVYNSDQHDGDYLIIWCPCCNSLCTNSV